jgi:hypothetical protein
MYIYRAKKILFGMFTKSSLSLIIGEMGICQFIRPNVETSKCGKMAKKANNNDQ